MLLRKHYGPTLLLLASSWIAGARPLVAAPAGRSGLEVAGAYVVDAHAYDNGHREDAEQGFHFHGNRVTTTLQVPFQYKDAQGICGVYAEYQQLVNNYHEAAAADGSKGGETMTMSGGGLSATLIAPIFVNLQTSLAVGVLTTKIEQTGKTPKSQAYPFAGEARFGLGAGPMLGASGVFFRVEYQAVALWNGKPTDGSTDKLRNAWVESYAPAVGFLLSF